MEKRKEFDLKEFEKLVGLMSDAKIPFETRKETLSGCENMLSFDRFPFEEYQICYPSIDVHWSDAIISFGSYGREQGLLEQMGLLPDTEEDYVQGYLDAETIFRRWEAHWNEINTNQVQKSEGFGRGN